MTDAEDIIRLLDLNPHPEGGYYRETLRAPAMPGERAAGTAIYFLLAAGEVSAWHRVDAAEAWHWYAGARHPGQHLETGQRPQIVVPSHAWQTAESLGAWTPAGCTVSQTRCRNLSAPRPGLHVRRNPLAVDQRVTGHGRHGSNAGKWADGAMGKITGETIRRTIVKPQIVLDDDRACLDRLAGPRCGRSFYPAVWRSPSPGMHHDRPQAREGDDKAA